MKKFICGILVGSLCTLSISSLASGVWDNIDVLKNDIKVVANGNEVDADNFLYQDTTYLPLRAVSTALGEKVEYDEQSNTAYIGERKDDNLNNTEIKSKYIPDNFLLQDYHVIKDGRYYVSEHLLREKYAFIQGAINESTKQISYKFGDKTIWIDYIIEEDRMLLPYDIFVDEILPLLK